jgi:formylglycine-generating enzyme
MMIELDGGTYRMGSTISPEEAPVREVRVRPFCLDAHAVTNAEFAAFVSETGYHTTAEQPLDPRQFPAATSWDAGSLVFVPTAGPVRLDDPSQWWRWIPGASWRRPRGPGSTNDAIPDHPVVHVSYFDAVAYAEWCGKRLPTEPEWEFAARGGLDQATYSWGEEPNDGTLANTWQGAFPHKNVGARGWYGTAPVGSFPPNGLGLFEMTGNVWEWTSSVWSSNHAGGCTCGVSPDPLVPQSRVVKGGSHLCAPEYCLRYRPAARSPQTEDSATTHIGFRCARDL